MSSFSHNYKYIELTNSYTIQNTDPHYLYIKPKNIALSIDITLLKFYNGISYKLYNLSDKYSISINTFSRTYILKPKSHVEVISQDGVFRFSPEENSDVILDSNSPIGICRLQTGGGSGKWCHVDRNGVPIVLPKNYFTNHPIYSNISSVIIDGQYMVRIPKFYVKYEKITSDNDPRGLPKGSKIKYISPIKLNGYHCHPAFMYNGSEINQVYIGSYLGYVSNNKLHSVPNVSPTVSVTYQNFKTYATNTGSGFMLISLYQLAIIQLLLLIEYKTSNINSFLGNGYSSGVISVNDSKNHTPWRNFYALYNNIWQMFSGTNLISKKIYLQSNTGSSNLINTNITETFGYKTYILDTIEGKSTEWDFDDVFLVSTTVSNKNSATYPYFVLSYSSNTKDACPIFGGAYNWITIGSGIFSYAYYNNYSYSNQGSRLAKV